MYLKRHAENTVRRLAEMFGAVLVTGLRQVGKTTLLRELTRPMPYVTLDDPVQLDAARRQPGGFFRETPPPVVIDEVQYAPELFPHIKMVLDRTGAKGQFFMSGSQQFHMMQRVSESLAGRLGLLVLPGLSLRETCGVACDAPFLPSDDYFAARGEATDLTSDAVWAAIVRGSMPELRLNEGFDGPMFYAAYVRTYLERDVRALAQVGDESRFLRFMTVVAACTGQLLNLSSLARDVGISQPTAERWLAVLRASHLVHLLPPYSGNRIKQAVKTPKLYFLDTGLAAWLTRWPTPDVLKNGAMAGAFFETFVVVEILKSWFNRGILEPPLYFYRDRSRREIDLIIEENGVLYPLEIKKHADPSKRDVAAFRLLEEIPGVERGPGGVICLYERPAPLADRDRVIPVGQL